VIKEKTSLYAAKTLKTENTGVKEDEEIGMFQWSGTSQTVSHTATQSLNDSHCGNIPDVEDVSSGVLHHIVRKLSNVSEALTASIIRVMSISTRPRSPTFNQTRRQSPSYSSL
jgi:hypothetical protein